MTLKEFRKQNGYTLAQFSSLLNVSVSALCKYERGELATPQRLLDTIKNTFNIEIEKTNKDHVALYDMIDYLKEENKQLKEQLLVHQMTSREIQKLEKLIKKLKGYYGKS